MTKPFRFGILSVFSLAPILRICGTHLGCRRNSARCELFSAASRKYALRSGQRVISAARFEQAGQGRTASDLSCPILTGHARKMSPAISTHSWELQHLDMAVVRGTCTSWVKPVCTAERTASHLSCPNEFIQPTEQRQKKPTLCERFVLHRSYRNREDAQENDCSGMSFSRFRLMQISQPVQKSRSAQATG